LSSILGGASASTGHVDVSSNSHGFSSNGNGFSSNGGGFHHNGAPAMHGGGAMESILRGIEGSNGASMVGSPSGGQFSSSRMSQESMAVVSGLVEEFMHKMALQPGERTCLQQNMGTLTGDLMGTVGDVVTAIKALVQGQGTIEKSQTGGVVSAGIDSAMKIASLVTLATQLLKNCVHGDALVMLKTCANHLVNGTYLEHRFIVNGVDIAHSLSDGIVAFEHHDFHRFGADIGGALRMLVLSNATTGTRLPEGVPEQVIIQRATAGLMSGFFTQGSDMEITDAQYPDIDIDVDLHACIAGNSPFFKEIWMGLWDLIAQLSAMSKTSGGITAAFSQIGQAQQGGGQPKWAGDLMVAMMQFPMALDRCGISQDMQHTFMEAIKTLGDLHVQFHFPQDGDGLGVTGSDQATMVANRMAKAVEAWTQWDFEKFGRELGMLFRELVTLAFPQKYSVDASGRLALYGQSMGAAKKAASISASLAIIGGAAVSLLVAFTAVRTRRSVQHLQVDRSPIMDIEDGDAVESVE